MKSEHGFTTRNHQTLRNRKIKFLTQTQHDFLLCFRFWTQYEHESQARLETDAYSNMEMVSCEIRTYLNVSASCKETLPALDTMEHESQARHGRIR
jgi:hypothetical protein